MTLLKRILAWFGRDKQAVELGRKPVHSLPADEVAELLDYDHDFLFGGSDALNSPSLKSCKTEPRTQYSQDGIEAARHFKCIFGTNEQRDIAIRFWRKQNNPTALESWVYNKDTE